MSLYDTGAPSLCAAIAGTINRSDFARFDAVFADPTWRRALEKNASVLETLEHLTSVPAVDTAGRSALATKIASQQRFDVIQVRPAPGGYVVKVASAPDNFAPVESFLTTKQAEEALPQETLQAADQQGAATVTGVEAEPDPLVEQVAPITTFGLYKVLEKGSGKQVIGYVIPQLLDPRTGQMVPQALFVNGSQYAHQSAVVGSQVGLNFNLPADPNIRGLGAFYTSDGRSILVTVPFEVQNEITVEGKKYYAARTMDGQDVQLALVDLLKKPTMISDREIAIPKSFSFLRLDMPIQLEDGQGATAGMAPMKTAQASAYPTRCEIRAWGDLSCDLRGPVFDKVGSGEQSWVDGVFHLAAAGVPQNLAVELLAQSAEEGRALELFGLRPLSTPTETIKAASARGVLDALATQLPARQCLLKEAAALSDTASVDAVLALNFLNPENVHTFVAYIPELEETSARLANLVLASQLGLQRVPQQAAVNAMKAIEKVVTALKDLQTHAI